MTNPIAEKLKRAQVRDGFAVILMSDVVDAYKEIDRLQDKLIGVMADFDTLLEQCEDQFENSLHD